MGLGDGSTFLRQGSSLLPALLPPSPMMPPMMASLNPVILVWHGWTATHLQRTSRPFHVSS